MKKRTLFMASVVVSVFLWAVHAVFAQPPRGGLSGTPRTQSVATNQASTTASPITQVSAQMPKPEPPKTVQIAEPQGVPEIAATVNGDKITGTQLASEALRIHGYEVLSIRIKNLLIETETQKRKIVITQAEIEEEIKKMAAMVNLTLDQWQNRVLAEMNVNLVQYREDIVWPKLAIKKLAAEKITVSKADLDREVESLYGESVQVREIVLGNRAEAEQIRAKLIQEPTLFANMAMDYSRNPGSAPYGGLIPVVRRHSVDPILEKSIFALQENQISEVIEWPKGNYIIYTCVKRNPPVKVNVQAIRGKLEMKVRETKMREVAQEILFDLEKKAAGQIEMTMYDPELSKQNPTIAARVYGRTITRAELAYLCYRRYGEVVLDQMITKKIILQECEKQNLLITAKDIDEDIRETAANCHWPNEDGTPNIEGWLRMQLKETGMTLQAYKTNVVWPVLALKRLTNPHIKVSEDDIQKGFEANFGPKVRCLAIVLDNARVAQDVWRKAKNSPNVDYFGDLASEFSVETASKTGRGVVPLIQKHGGQPQLEEAAFKLKAGEISPIIQLEDSYFILFCLEQTVPVVTDLEEVRGEILEKIHEKKLLIGMERMFDQLHANATIKNNVTKRSQIPVSARANEDVPVTAANPAALRANK